ncbi:MAG: AraC family transcriptional regulator [Arcobacteraceae bacterium]|nr:AraC family transcriptional regulator [Arcobacteraceae bacterium]
MDNRFENLLHLIQMQSLKEGINHTLIPSVNIFKSSNTTQTLQTIYEPSLFIIIQGKKLVTINNQTIEYDSSSYLISSSFLPVSGKITQASENKPFLSLQIIFNLKQIFETIEQFSIKAKKTSHTKLAISSYNITENLLDATSRLVNLLKNPEDINALSDLYLKEILYRLLISNNNTELKQLAFAEGNAYKVYQTILYINDNLFDLIFIEDLAKSVNMSISSFHKHFKTITSVSPLKYIKIQRLQKAKSLMVSENMDITGASFSVGYQSPSQFSREYTSYFGISPSLDIKNIKQQWIKY